MTTIPLADFDKAFGSLIELSSIALGGSIHSCSDEFFADAINLLSVGPALSMKGQFGPKGALFDGWETRRHNPSYDWVIVRLGAPLSSVVGVDIDTANFSGNESPASGVWGAHLPNDADAAALTESSDAWFPLLPVSPLGPSSRHLFRLDKPSAPVTHLKLTMHPDGGIGRFRAYGTVLPPPRSLAAAVEGVDLAYVMNGATATGTSDQHFGRGGNIILPGRGIDMGDGWETKRSRGRLGSGKGDWTVIKLGEAGYLDWACIDTLHFVGNFPESAELHGITSDLDLPSQEAAWVPILARTKLGPHQEHWFQLVSREQSFTHVRVTILPDGGIKRLRVFGRPAAAGPSSALAAPPSAAVATAVTYAGATTTSSLVTVPSIPAVPLTADAFAPYGHVIASHPDARTARKEILIKRVNFGTAWKYNWLAPVVAAPLPAGTPEAKANFCVFRCDAQPGAVGSNGKASWDVTVLERHEYSTQAFVPMQGEGRYLVLVALGGADGKPDLSTLRAFMASGAQGISYNPAVWHHPLIAVDETTDFACIVNETGVDKIDCEIHQFGSTVAVVQEI